MVPSGRGAPGAFGSALGSNASDLLGLGGTPGWSGVKGASATSGAGGSAAGAIAEPEFDILAELLQLRLEPALRVLQFLDPAVGLAKRLLEPVDPHHETGCVVWVARAARNVGGRGRLAVEEIELRLSRRRKARGRRRTPRSRLERKNDVTGGLPDWVRFDSAIRRASVDFKSPRAAARLAALSCPARR